MIEVFGEMLGCRMFRKVGPWYAKRFGPSSHFNRKIVQLAARAEYDELIASYQAWRAQFLDERGELLPQYAPAALGGGFDETEFATPVVRRQTLPVPAGPNELW